MVFGIVDGECEFHTDNTTEKEISEAVEYIIERIPESEADAEPRTDLTRTDELDAKSSDEGTRPYPEEMAQEAPGKKVTLDFLTDDRYLGQQTPYEYLDDEQPKYLISQGTPREVNGKMRITLQLLATDRRLLLFADDPVVASKREKYGKFEIDSFGLQHVVTFRYKDIEDIRLSEGRLSDALVWESKSHTFKLKDFTNDDAEVESFIHYVKQQISQDSTANRVGRLVSAAESETVTGDRLRNRDGLILDKLDSDEQPHYILEGNPIYGVKIEGGASMDDQSAGLTSPIKTLTIRSIWAVLTDSRALLLVVKSGGVNSWSVPYDSITAVDRQEKATGYPLVFHTHGRTYYVDVSKELSSAQETELLEEAMNFVRDRVKSQTTSDSDDNESTSALDKLEQLKQLHDDGVITEEEFEEKKTELLEDI